jgi:hypothetical protein
MGTPNFVHLAELASHSRGKGKKPSKSRSSCLSGGPKLGGELEGIERMEVGEAKGGDVDAFVAVSPPSGLRLILESQGTHVPETPPVEFNSDPLKKMEAESLYGIQNVVGLNFATPSVANTERLEVIEVIDVKKKVIRERNLVDQ